MSTQEMINWALGFSGAALIISVLNLAVIVRRMTRRGK